MSRTAHDTHVREDISDWSCASDGVGKRAHEIQIYYLKRLDSGSAELKYPLLHALSMWMNKDARAKNQASIIHMLYLNAIELKDCEEVEPLQVINSSAGVRPYHAR